MEVRPDFVRLAGAEGVALCAAGFEEGFTLADVTCSSEQSQLQLHNTQQKTRMFTWRIRHLFEIRG